MELIFDIVKKLRNNEIRNIRNLLNSSPFDYEKVGKLFDLVTRYTEKGESYYSQKLYQKEPDNTFRVTKSRLKKLLEDAILHEKSLSGYSAEYINSILQARKRLLQGEILLGRGAYIASKNLLLQVSALGRKYSFHHELFQARMLLHRAQSINSGVREFEKSTQELLELSRIESSVNEAAILYYSLSNFLTHKTAEDQQIIAGPLAQLKRIETIHNEVNSPHTAYYYLYSHVLFHQYEQEYDIARKFCKKYLILLQNEPALYSKQKVANAHFQLAEISMRMGKLDEAQEYIDETLAFYNKDNTNYLITLGIAFWIAFHSENWKQAGKVIEEALKHPRLAVSKSRAATWHFFKACLLFKKKLFRDASQELNHATVLLNDKYGWNLSFRLLEIMILFESGHFDILDSRIINMKQFVKRTQKTSELFRPMQLIAILMEWHKNNLDLTKAWPVIQKKMKELNEFHKSHPFDANATELIRFEEWLLEKAGKR